MIKKIVSLLMRFPQNYGTQRLLAKLLCQIQEGPIKTGYGYAIDFRETGVSATAMRRQVIAGTYERPFFDLITQCLEPGNVAVDVGAHEGFLTLLMSKKVGKDGSVFAVEPNPENLAFIKSNINQNHESNIAVIEKAVSNKKSKMDFFCSPDMGANGSLIHFSHFAEDRSIKVEVDTLDNIFKDFKRIDFLKVDTEGNELEVFQGAEQILCNQKPLICFEVSLTFWTYFERSVEALFDIFRNRGFELFVAKGNKLCPYDVLDERILNLFAVHSSQKSALIDKGVVTPGGTLL